MNIWNMCHINWNNLITNVRFYNSRTNGFTYLNEYYRHEFQSLLPLCVLIIIFPGHYRSWWLHLQCPAQVESLVLPNFHMENRKLSLPTSTIWKNSWWYFWRWRILLSFISENIRIECTIRFVDFYECLYLKLVFFSIQIHLLGTIFQANTNLYWICIGKLWTRKNFEKSFIINDPLTRWQPWMKSSSLIWTPSWALFSLWWKLQFYICPRTCLFRSRHISQRKYDPDIQPKLRYI